jgi:hypothetical protein
MPTSPSTGADLLRQFTQELDAKQVVFTNAPSADSAWSKRNIPGGSVATITNHYHQHVSKWETQKRLRAKLLDKRRIHNASTKPMGSQATQANINQASQD